jgi:hypothetical protein
VKVDKLVEHMKHRGVTDDERCSMTPAEREAMKDIADEHGCAIMFDVLRQRWVFVQVMHPREVAATQSTWKRGPRMRPHPRSRRRWTR